MKLLDITAKIFSPIFVPLYLLLILYSALGIMKLPTNSLLYLLFFVLFTVTILPLLGLYFAKRQTLIKSVDNPDKRDRTLILTLMLVIYILNLKMWYDRTFDIFYIYIFGNSLLITLILLLFNQFFPLNWHTTAMGSLLGFYLMLLNLGMPVNFILISSILLITGLVGVAQNSRQPAKLSSLTTGFLLGIGATFFLGKILLEVVASH